MITSNLSENLFEALRKTNTKTEKVFTVVGFIIGLVLLMAIWGTIMMLSWNFLVLSTLEAVGLPELSSINILEGFVMYLVLELFSSFFREGKERKEAQDGQ